MYYSNAVDTEWLSLYVNYLIFIVDLNPTMCQTGSLFLEKTSHRFGLSKSAEGPWKLSSKRTATLRAATGLPNLVKEQAWPFRAGRILHLGFTLFFRPRPSRGRGTI